MNEFGNEKKTVEALTAAAGRSFGRIVGLFKQLGDLGYTTYCRLYESYVLSVACYGAGVWGFRPFPAPRVLQNRINRFYLGVHRFAPVAATSLLMDTVDIRYHRWIEILRLHNRIMQMDPDRIPHKVYMWEEENGGRGWLSDVKTVAETLHLPPPSHHVLYDLDVASTAVKKLSNDDHWNESKKKPKLDCFVEVTDRSNVANLVRANLKRRPRSLTAKLLCGILPLEVETGRYKKGEKVDRELRHCKVCNGGTAETEYHFLFSCEKLKEERSMSYVNCELNIADFMPLQDCEKVKSLIESERVKEFGNMVEILFEKRRQCLFKPNM